MNEWLKATLALASSLPLFAAAAGTCPEILPGGAVGRLSVRGVQLDSSTSPCKPEARILRDSQGAATVQQMSCTFGEPKDTTRVTFTADGKRVIRLFRTQFLKPSDPSTAAVLKEASRFYGPPSMADMPSDLVAYGNAFNLSRKGKAVEVSRNACGVGMLISGQACGDGSFGLPDCRGLGVRYVNFDLVNNAELEKSLVEGAKAIKEVERKKLSSLKF